jgi:hypothetical protein
MAAAGLRHSRAPVVTILLFHSLIVAATAVELPVPPAMTKRAIAPSTNELLGTQVSLEDRGVKFTLFLPSAWTNSVSSNTTLCAHFHTVPWFAIQEHVRRGAHEPLIVFALGEGSTTYRVPFEDTNRFARIVALTENELKQRSASRGTHITGVDVSSFSAGYAAVRELVKSPEAFKMIRRIALLDSMYAGLEPREKGSTNRRPLAAQTEVWVPFAKAAMRGEKTFVFTHSQVPTPSYASSRACAEALLARLKLEAQSAEPKSSLAASDPDFPLLKRADSGRFHVWSYGGEDAQAHLTHVRHMADVWNALDAAESERGAR